MTKEQQVAIQKALTRLRNAQARVAKVREDNARREQDAIALERAALDALREMQKAAGLPVQDPDRDYGEKVPS